MTLMLHAGAHEVDMTALRAVETPRATLTHVPIPHHRLVDSVRHSLGFYGHEVVDERHGITEDGMRYFGVMLLKSAYGGYEDAVALRNSHDKSFPIGIGFGGRVFCCDNLSLIADQVIKRKHTANAKRDLPSLIAQMVEPLADARERQERVFTRYRDSPISVAQADHAIMEMYRNEVINLTKIADVWSEFEHPSFTEMGGEKTAWTLFNAATFILNGKVVAEPRNTQNLHRIIDGICIH
jgi:hypothetical protein